MYSVDTEEEANSLLLMACPTNIKGEFVAPELAEKQTLENLDKFSDRIDRMHQILVKNGRCECKERK